MKRAVIIILILIFLSILHTAVAAAMKPGEFLVLCYHAVPLEASPDDKYSISRNRFVEQMEYLRTHGYHPVSFNDILEARDGKKELPKKPVLLTFDDAYISYYEFVFSFLEELGYPSVLAVVGNFIDNPPEDMPEPLMNWDQIREVSAKKLVEVVSHTYDFHKSVQYNPSGNVAAAVNVLTYDPQTKTYEKEDGFRARLEADFIAQKNLFSRKLGFIPEVIVWPFGKYNQISLKVAKKNGFPYTFTLEDGLAHIDRLNQVNRILIENKPIDEFIEALARPEGEKDNIRAVQVDLDLIYDPDSYEQTDKNLGRLIDRLVEMKVNTVFLQAFADPEGTGNIESVYFYNRVLPVRSDIFSHAVHQLLIRDITVYAWMPTLSIVLPDKELNERLKVRTIPEAEPVPSTSWYKRLSPFSGEVKNIVKIIYEDLAAHSQIEGVLFQDDAYLTDFEDFHPAAVAKYEERFGKDVIAAEMDEEADLTKDWARYKTKVLIDFINTLKQRIRKYRPNALFARNIYSDVVEDPGAELWFAQDYDLFLKNYDHVVVMAYPQIDEVKRPLEWLKSMVGRANAMPQGIEKTVFKIQAYNWRKEAWISDGILLREMRNILSSGAKHLAYYPDNFWDDKPSLNIVKLEMSTKTYPFIP